MHRSKIYRKIKSIVRKPVLSFFQSIKTIPKVSAYVVESNKIPKSFDGFKIVHLSDLHNEVYGKRNACLLSLIDEENPDAVFMTGDMVSYEEHNITDFIDFCGNLSKKYPVYYVNGNHEIYDLSKQEFLELNNGLDKAGVICLDNRKFKLIYNEDSISLCGLSYPMKYYRGVDGNRRGHHIFTVNDMHRYVGKAPENDYVILLAHNPLDFETYAEWGADLTFSGHIHGGLIRLPVVKGIVSPEMKLMPKYKEGVYDIDGKKLVVSRGLNSVRVFNPPEIVLVELKSSK